ncbi:MAG TPA: hypothetical protein VE153_29120 [Myxococcus sp.]|nr:hypothetical protein [Myxococcus sp.]
MRMRGDWSGVVAVVVGSLMLAAGVPLLVPSWVLERREAPAPPPPVEAPGNTPPVPLQESAKDSGPQEPLRPPE